MPSLGLQSLLPKRHQPTSGAAKNVLDDASSASETRLLMDPDDDDDVANEQSSSSPPTSCQTTVPKPSPPMSDFLFIKIVARLALGVLRKFWAFSSAAILAIILFYWLCGGIMAFLLVTFALSGILYHAGDRLLYHPDQPPTSRVFVPSPSIIGLPFDSVYIKSRDRTRIHLFLVKQTPDRLAEAPTILFLHGNAGNIGHRLMNVKGLYSQLGCNVCLLEYRGYGHSDGTPSEEGLYMDAQAGLDFLNARSDINPNRIIVFGRSLGGAIAIELASRAENRDKIASLLIENTFTSIPDIARSLFNFRLVRWIPTWCYKNQFKSRWKVCRISVPVLFLSGMADALVPSKMMTELFSSCGAELKRMAKFKGGTHNETWMCPQYYHTVKHFLQEVVKIGPIQHADGISVDPAPQFINDTVII